jgi:hypothetical protein
MGQWITLKDKRKWFSWLTDILADERYMDTMKLFIGSDLV